MLEELYDQKETGLGHALSRRDILKMGLVGFLGAVTPLALPGQSNAMPNVASWKISFRNAHTGESFNGVYRIGDRYLPDAFDRINYVLRDFRTKEVFPMDPRVIDLVKVLQDKSRSSAPIEVLSGYRSPKTNSMLRGASGGVARNSYHMYGQAMDIRIPGFNTRKLRDLAKRERVGGVGFYARSNFVHVDTGDVRSW